MPASRSLACRPSISGQPPAVSGGGEIHLAHGKWADFVCLFVFILSLNYANFRAANCSRAACTTDHDSCTSATVSSSRKPLIDRRIQCTRPLTGRTSPLPTVSSFLLLLSLLLLWPKKKHSDDDDDFISGSTWISHSCAHTTFDRKLAKRFDQRRTKSGRRCQAISTAAASGLVFAIRSAGRRRQQPHRKSLCRPAIHFS